MSDLMTFGGLKFIEDRTMNHALNFLPLSFEEAKTRAPDFVRSKQLLKHPIYPDRSQFTCWLLIDHFYFD